MALTLDVETDTLELSVKLEGPLPGESDAECAERALRELLPVLALALEQSSGALRGRRPPVSRWSEAGEEAISVRRIRAASVA